MPVDQDKAAKFLESKGAKKPCHRCGAESFSILPEFSKIQIHDKIDGPLVLGGPVIPAIIVGCNNCGAITYHAAGLLGLLEGEK